MAVLNEELIVKAKQAKSAEELLVLAKENEVELSTDEAKEYFEQLNKSGELSDDELDNVSGGGCVKRAGEGFRASDGRLVVTVGYCCDNFECKYCGRKSRTHFCSRYGERNSGCCDTCKFMSYENGLWLCNHESNRK